MTLPPNPPDDDRLVDFLRRHRPAPPPAAPQLEAQMMAQLTPLSSPPVLTQPRRWAIPAVAAALVLGVGGWVVGRSTVPSLPTASASEVEVFLADTWYGSAYDDEVRLPLDTTQPDWLASVYATPY
ncbi:hypothetical protein [Halomicronema sp. CCY15110]|uniref:hypothetical protein n=1 Tax=Halomicronema sp. CCY15110 TaxID=2767773 RepID=UPI00194E542A|nr:hypothetical protein [Halomicronema sp. CCY15110]